MKDLSLDVLHLIEKYGDDRKTALKENGRLEYMYALSDMRENLLEWYPFEKEASLLQIQADFGALTGLYSRKVKQVVVLDESKMALHVAKKRHEDRTNIEYIQADLFSYAREYEACFDYVVIAGSLKKPYEYCLDAAKMILKPGGRLILAVCNEFGLKYMTGAKREEDCFTRNRIIELLGGSFASMEFYYPMPDYKLPAIIYSQYYLPRKGDLTNQIPAYDYPKYLLLDVGAAYDAVCEDQQFENFANSFLIIWSNHERN